MFAARQSVGSQLLQHIQGAIQPYAWGSRTALTEILSIAATGEPMAELWLGAHPALPSTLITLPSGADTADSATGAGHVDTLHNAIAGDTSHKPIAGDTLLSAIATDPTRWLHPEVIERFHGTLPYLLKVLAIAEPLSLQTHPSKAQAAAGFAREEANMVDRMAANRFYRDRNHKPELICALTDLHALSAFRDIDETRKLLGLIDDPATHRLYALLDGGSISHAFEQSLRGAVFQGDPAQTDRLASAIDRYVAIADNLSITENLTWMATLARRYPGDGGVAVALLLNYVHLRPGEALFLGAGNVHAYLHGVGVEIMASSDNVLRGGLTPKAVNIDALLAVTTTESGPAPIVPAVPYEGANARALPGAEQQIQEWPVPVEDFRLLRAQCRGTMTFPLPLWPAIALCTEGSLRLQTVADGSSLPLHQGQSALITQTDQLEIDGTGTIFVALPGERRP